MYNKKEMSKHERKQLEREIRRNRSQRKENRKEVNKLKSKYPTYILLVRNRERNSHLLEDSGSVTRKVCGECVGGIFA